MRFTCERDDLSKALQAVSGVVAAKGIHPVYESVQIVAADTGLELLATDLEIGMRYRLPAGEALRVEGKGTAVVPAQRLSSICKELPKGQVALTWNADARECVLTAGRGRFRLQGQSPEDFPEIPAVDAGQGIAIETSVLRNLVRLTAFAAARERMRFALNGVLVRAEGETIECVATDGRRLARAAAPLRNDGRTEFSAIVPTKGLQHLERTLGDGDAEVRLAVGNNHLSAGTARATVVSRLVEGSFPNYRDVIPQTCQRKAVIPREAFAAALRRAALVTSRDAQSVKLRFDDEGLTVSAQSAEGSAEETMPCEQTGGADTIGFNPEFLLDALGVLTGESVVFEWNDRKSPGKVTEGTYTYVVMPVSLE